ncbi:MAG: pilus assembly protein PilM [bacterium]
MTKLNEILTVFRRNYSDVVGLDIGVSGTKAVRLKRVHGVPTVIAVDILPAISLPDSEEGLIVPCQLPKVLKARYVAVAVSKGGGIVKLLTFPVHSGKTNDEHVLELMGLGTETYYRLGYEPIFENRSVFRALASALPDAFVKKICQLFPSGVPAPCSIEVSGLASLTAFSRLRGNENVDECYVVMDFGAAVTLVAFYNKNTLALVRKLDFGTANVLKKLQDSLGVDQDVALGILNDGSFDVSKVVHHALEPFLQQLTISWDFVERRENIRIGKLFVCGGGVGLHLWAQEIESATGQVPIRWNPFEGIAVQGGAIPEKFKGQELRFSAAVGAALAMFKAG